MDVFNEREQLLALKVMRLTKPSFLSACQIPAERDSNLSLSLQKLNSQDTISGNQSEPMSLKEQLTLPQSFGNIFLGETFTSYVSVHNDSNQAVNNVSVKADLQTSSKRLSLASAHHEDGSIPQLSPDQSVDDIIHHEVKELGTHILVCAVFYTTQANETKSFRKFFKFQVLKPLDVKTKFYNAESNQVYLEAQVQNIMSGPVFVENVSLEPSSAYRVRELNSPNMKRLRWKAKEDENEEGLPVTLFGKVNCLAPGDTRQYLYCLSPLSDSIADLKRVTTIGKLDITWKTNLGEKGRLQTSHLQRMVPSYGDIRLTVRQVPGEVRMEEPFPVSCVVSNCSERTMELDVCLTPNTDHPGLKWVGVSGKHLAKLEPLTSAEVTLEILPVKQGLQTISGIRLTDTFLNRTYEYDDLVQVLVNK